MSGNSIVARKRNDGTIVQVLPDGSEQAFPRSKTPELSDAAIESAAQGDPDAPLLTADQLARAKPVAPVKTLRRSLRMTQEEFAARFHLSLGTLRDWEQGRYLPDQAARAYLEVISRAPDVVMQALGTQPDITAPHDS
jgi:putative transcriptional regulator